MGGGTRRRPEGVSERHVKGGRLKQSTASVPLNKISNTNLKVSVKELSSSLPPPPPPPPPSPALPGLPQEGFFGTGSTIISQAGFCRLAHLQSGGSRKQTNVKKEKETASTV